MATRKTSSDDPLAPLTLAVGQEDLLLDRAVQQVVAAARAADADTDVRDLTSDQLQPGTLAELTSPSLFAERKVVVVRNAQDLSADTIKDVKAYLDAPAEEITLVLLHAGGAKGKGLLDAARKAGAREVACPKTTKPAERLTFVRSEFRALGRSATPEACQALVDSIGSDLRELASAVSQLAADVEGTIDDAVVGRYYTGRAEASSFNVADRAVEGRTAEALEALRWSLSTGVAPVLITSALAQGVRAIGKLSSARGGRPADLARELGMPPWKIDRVRQQMRGWTPDGVATALRAVADADAGVKGAVTTRSTRWRRRSSRSPVPPGRTGNHHTSAYERAYAEGPGDPSWGGRGRGLDVKAGELAPAWRTQSRTSSGTPVRSGREGPLSPVRRSNQESAQPWREATLAASADFLLAAAFLWMTPFEAALSSLRDASRAASEAFSTSPAAAASRALRIAVLSDDLTALLRRRAFSLVLFRLIWDLMFATKEPFQVR